VRSITGKAIMTITRLQKVLGEFVEYTVEDGHWFEVDFAGEYTVLIGEDGEVAWFKAEGWAVQDIETAVEAVGDIAG
jgi:hypothetical protein